MPNLSHKECLIVQLITLRSMLSDFYRLCWSVLPWKPLLVQPKGITPPPSLLELWVWQQGWWPLLLRSTSILSSCLHTCCLWWCSDSDGVYYVVPVWRPLLWSSCVRAVRMCVCVCVCRFIDLLVHNEFLYQITMPAKNNFYTFENVLTSLQHWY